MSRASRGGFGWRVRWTRDQARLTQEVLADRAAISRGWLARIEGCHAEPKVSDAMALYEVLAEQLPGLRLEWFLMGGGQPVDAVRVEAAVERREFVRRLVTGAVLLPSALPIALDPERLSSAPRLDSGLLDGWEGLTGVYAGLRPMQPPRELLPMIETHLFHLRSHVEDGSARDSIWRRLLSVTAGTGALAAWVCLMVERRGDARAHLDLAEALAREAEDRDALVLVLMLRADLMSAIPSGGQDGFPPLARRYLGEALELASPGTPVVLRAPILLRSAEESACAGREAEALDYLDRAACVIASGQSRDHYLRPTWGRAPDVERVLTSFRGNCLQMLGRTQEAIDLISPAGESRFPADRPVTLTDLAAAHAQQGDLDRACELLSTAIDLTAAHGLAVAARRMVGVRRRHLARWEEEPLVREVDDRLAAIL